MVEELGKQLEELKIEEEQKLSQTESVQKSTEDVKVGYAFNIFMTKHEKFNSHPERPERITAINAYLKLKDLDKRVIPVDCPMIDMKLVQAIHTEDLIKLVSETKYKYRSL